MKHDYENILQQAEKLARIKIDPEERVLFSEQIGKILTFVEKLSELDTDSVLPTTHVLPLQNVSRKDEPRPSLERETVFKAAPDHDEKHLRVPKVI